MAAIWPLTYWKSSDQEPTIKHTWPIKVLDPGRKRFNRQHVSDYLFSLYLSLSLSLSLSLYYIYLFVYLQIIREQAKRLFKTASSEYGWVLNLPSWCSLSLIPKVPTQLPVACSTSRWGPMNHAGILSIARAPLRIVLISVHMQLLTCQEGMRTGG